MNKVKTHSFADGRPQCEYIGNKETKSPTVNAIEGREVVTCGIPRAFQQLDWPKDKPTYLKFDDIMVDMLFKIYPYLKKHVITREKHKLMYGKLNKVVLALHWGQFYFTKKNSNTVTQVDFCHESLWKMHME